MAQQISPHDIEHWLRRAMAEAESAAQAGDHPYGAVIVDQHGNVVATGRNEVNTELDPTSHAETNAIRDACRQVGSLSLAGYRLFTNGAPCTMCATTIIRVGISDVWYSAPPDPGRTLPTLEELVTRIGLASPTVNQGILASEASAQIARWNP